MWPLDPNVKLTRAEFFMELLTQWEECLQIIQRNPNGTLEEYGTEKEVEAAIHVLKRSFHVSELIPTDSYEKYKNQINEEENGNSSI